MTPNSITQGRGKAFQKSRTQCLPSPAKCLSHLLQRGFSRLKEPLPWLPSVPGLSLAAWPLTLACPGAVPDSYSSQKASRTEMCSIMLAAQSCLIFLRTRGSCAALVRNPAGQTRCGEGELSVLRSRSCLSRVRERSKHLPQVLKSLSCPEPIPAKTQKGTSCKSLEVSNRAQWCNP